MSRELCVPIETCTLSVVYNMTDDNNIIALINRVPYIWYQSIMTVVAILLVILVVVAHTPQPETTRIIYSR